MDPSGALRDQEPLAVRNAVVVFPGGHFMRVGLKVDPGDMMVRMHHRTGNVGERAFSSLRAHVESDVPVPPLQRPPTPSNARHSAPLQTADRHNPVIAPVINDTLDPLALSPHLRWTCQSG